MFVKHPHKPILIDVSRYAIITLSVTEETEIHFYTNTPEEDPAYVIEFPDKEKRDAWFLKFASRYTHV